MMRALPYHGLYKVSVENIPDPPAEPSGIADRGQARCRFAVPFLLAGAKGAHHRRKVRLGMAAEVLRTLLVNLSCYMLVCHIF